MSLCVVFDSISSNMDEVLLINQSANVFVIGNFNIHHNNWLTYSGGTGTPDLTQMVNLPTRIPDCDSHNPALLDLFLSSDISICSVMAFRPLGNSEHVAVSVSIDFSSNTQRDAPFHCIVYDYSHADGVVFVII